MIDIIDTGYICRFLVGPLIFNFLVFQLSQFSTFSFSHFILTLHTHTHIYIGVHVCVCMCVCVCVETPVWASEELIDSSTCMCTTQKTLRLKGCLIQELF